MKLTLAEIAAIVGGEHYGINAVATGVSIDTRSLTPGDLFVAIKGPRYDGHDFSRRAQSLGASGVLSRFRVEGHASCGVVVSDPVVALGRLAAHVRQAKGPRVVAVTGSNGKTTVKEMLSSILRREGPTLQTRGNLNNHLGLPLTLLALDQEPFAVVEMGASHVGEIAELTAMAQPDVGLVTMAGEAHLGGFGSREAIARAKGELFAGLAPDAVAVINADDLWCDLWCELASHCRIVRFGLSETAQVRAVETGQGMRVLTPAGEFDLKLALPGRHNVLNALAATAAAGALGVSLTQIAAGLAATEIVPGRLNLQQTPAGFRVIDDTYNANPGSFRAALAYLQEVPAEHWLVVGDMGELGETALDYHRQLGDEARLSGVTRLFALGHLASATAESFGSGGKWFTDIDGLTHSLRTALHEQSPEAVVVLVKGSRFMKMERVVQALCEVGTPDRNVVGTPEKGVDPS